MSNNTPNKSYNERFKEKMDLINNHISEVNKLSDEIEEYFSKFKELSK